MSRAEAIGTGIAAADDYDVTTFCANESIVGDRVTFASSILEREVIHSEVDALEFAARDWQIAGLARSPRQHDSVEALLQLSYRQVDTDVGIGAKVHTGLSQESYAPIEYAPFHLELGDTVP